MGEFDAPIVYFSATAFGSSAAADFNNDTRLDLAVGTGTGLIGIMLQQSNGDFAPPSHWYQAGLEARSVKAGDFNRDGKADVSVISTTSNQGDDSLGVFLGNGNGTLQDVVLYPAARDGMDVATGDVNGDEITDVLIVNYTSRNVSVFPGNGNGTFQNAHHTTPISNSPLFSIGTGDFNGDGRADMIATGATQQVMYILPNTSPLYTLSGTITLEASADPEQLATVELKPTSYSGPTLTRKVILTPSGFNSGTFRVVGIPSGRYDVSVKVTGWLKRTQNISVLNDVSSFSASLLSGDTNGDNSVDVFDLDILIRNFDQAGDP